MGNINVGDLQEGMKIAKDVTNVNGQMLMPKGIQIVEKHIALLKAWGITEVEIDGVSREEVSSKAAAQLNPEILAAADNHMKELFRNADLEHPMNKELFGQCVLRYAKQEAAKA